MSESKRKYFIKVDHEKLVEVSKEVYTAYYQMKRQERYQLERDLKNGLIYYDDWDADTINGQDYIQDTTSNIEDFVIRKMRYRAILSFLKEHDKQKIVYLLLLGKKECEIAEMLGMTQSGVSKAKNRLLKSLKTYLEKFF